MAAMGLEAGSSKPYGLPSAMTDNSRPTTISPTASIIKRNSIQSQKRNSISSQRTAPSYTAGPLPRKPVALYDAPYVPNPTRQSRLYYNSESNVSRDGPRSASPIVSFPKESIGSPPSMLPPLHSRDLSLDVESRTSEQTAESSVLPSTRNSTHQYRFATAVSSSKPQLQQIDVSSMDGSIFSAELFDELSEQGSGVNGQSSSSSDVQTAPESYPQVPPHKPGTVRSQEADVQHEINNVNENRQQQNVRGRSRNEQKQPQRPQQERHSSSYLENTQESNHRPTLSLGAWSNSKSSDSSGSQIRTSSVGNLMPPQPPSHRPMMLPRPPSLGTLTAEQRGRPRSSMLSPNGSPGSPLHPRAQSTPRRSPDSRPVSYIDLLNTPYAQQVAPAPLNLDNTELRSVVGSNASLLETKKTLEMYRANVKKTSDAAVQYEFAVFMVHAAHEPQTANSTDGSNSGADAANGEAGAVDQELLREARTILQRLSDRGYPFAQYYLGDGYASGLFSKGKENYDHAFPLFLAASKHGHAESGYRAALCYEFGWGCRKDYAKAIQFYRNAAARNHPGAAARLGRACLTGDMGIGENYREGLRWMRRAQESADHQYNSAPYDLGLLHVTGYGDDVFKDEAYAAQLFTQAADLGHPEANLLMGEAYEHGRLSCPKDPALSVHFYNGAAQEGIPQAMMALCAWYLVGAPPVLPKDNWEAYEWAKKAAEHG